jgi:hypothetical protein
MALLLLCGCFNASFPMTIALDKDNMEESMLDIAVDNTKESISFINSSSCSRQDPHQHHLLLQNQATPHEVWLQAIHSLNRQ